MILFKMVGVYSWVFCLVVEYICCSLSIVIEYKIYLYVLVDRE